MKKQSKYHEDFEPIDDTPDNVARAILSTPPKKNSEWEYMKAKEQDKS